MAKKPSTRVDVVLGDDLYRAVLLGAVEADHTPSQEIRTRLAKSYGLTPPEIKEGNPNPGQARKKKPVKKA